MSSNDTQGQFFVVRYDAWRGWISLRVKNNVVGLAAVSGFLVASPILHAADFAEIKIEDRMQAAERMAERLQIDGRAEDWNVGNWGAYPAVNDGAGDCADRSRDLVSTRVVANRTGLFVCVATAGMPTRENYAYGFRVDFFGTTEIDLEFGETTPTTCATVSRHVPGKKPTNYPIRDVKVGMDKCVEWFVPWSALAQVLPTEDRESIVGDTVRSWVRVTTYSWDHRRRVITDTGAAAACLRLPRNTAEINEPLPERADECAEMGLMVEGQAYVNVGAKNGPTSVGFHRNKWCYDLTVVDTTMSPSRVPRSLDNTQYYAWGKDLIAPFNGTLVGAVDSAEDHAPFCNNCDLSPSNVAYLQADGKTLWFVHNRKGSLVPKVGDNLRVGDRVAKIGATGPTGWPHVHVQVHRGNNRDDLIPIVLRDVRVKLNPGPNDFWARDLSRWPIEEGFFVEKSPTRATN